MPIFYYFFDKFDTIVIYYTNLSQHRLEAITSEERAKPSRALWAGPLASFLVVATQEDGKRKGKELGELQVREGNAPNDL